MIYDDCVHVEHYRTYVKLVDLIYIKFFFRQLITYLKHCFVCYFIKLKNTNFTKNWCRFRQRRCRTISSSLISLSNFRFNFMNLIRWCSSSTNTLKKYFDFKKVNLYNQKMNKFFLTFCKQTIETCQIKSFLIKIKSSCLNFEKRFSIVYASNCW